MRKRIIIGSYADVRNGGGVANWTRHVARELGRDGYDVLILSRRGSSEEKREDELYRIQYLPDDLGWRWRIPSWARLARLVECLRESDFGTVEAVLTLSAPWVIGAKSVWPNLPVIHLFPSMVWRCLPHINRTNRTIFTHIDAWLTKHQERQAIRQADRLIVPAPSVAEDIERLVGGSRAKFHIAPTGVDDLLEKRRLSREAVRASLGTPDDAVVVITTGTLDGNKNQAYLIRTISKIQANNLWLWVVGDGQDRKMLESLVRESGIESRVRFTGWRRDVENLYPAADILVHSAWYDCFPNVYLEAMVCGLPVVGPKNDGMTVFSSLGDVITDGKEGYRYSLKSPDELISLLKMFLDRPEMLSTMGAAARTMTLARYSWVNYVDAIKAGIRDCKKKDSRERNE